MTETMVSPVDKGHAERQVRWRPGHALEDTGNTTRQLLESLEIPCLEGAIWGGYRCLAAV